MKLLISDANVLIDLEEAELSRLIFDLEFEFATPDLLFEEELREHHEHLIEKGLLLAELTSESMIHSFELVDRYRKTGRMDCLTMALAKQEACVLLTGDKELRLAAEQEQIEVHGTIWLVEQLLLNQLLSHEEAVAAFERMKVANRRLPWSTANAMLRSIGKK
jgi:predicted nucleic acid-binding protein